MSDKNYLVKWPNYKMELTVSANTDLNTALDRHFTAKFGEGGFYIESKEMIKGVLTLVVFVVNQGLVTVTCKAIGA